MMIEYFVGIGQYAKEKERDMNLIYTMINEVRKQDFDNVFEINIKNNEVESKVKAFYEDVVKDALFHQKGNFFLGGGLRLDNYNEKKLKQACDFCEINEKIQAKIKELVEEYINTYNNRAFLLLKINDKSPKELFEEKFLKRMFETGYKLLDGEHICHLCGKKGEVFEKFGYSFYTNDKQIYSCINDKDKWGIVVCFDCLTNILFARKYIEEHLSTYWLDCSVMFIPHYFDETVADIYESSQIDNDGSVTSFLQRLRTHENDVISDIGKTNSLTDIVFYSENPTNKSWKIYHAITSVLPSRFTKLAELLKEYDLTFWQIFNIIANVKVIGDNPETTLKEKLRFLDAIFHGKKIDRNLFFKRVMAYYKVRFKVDEHRKYFVMRSINKVYNFLVDCGCLEKGVKQVDYKDYHELFADNPQYFDTDEKKAWFILGRVFDYVNYNMKGSNKSEGSDKTSLEKKFFFARKFNHQDFIYFCNLLEDKAIKYNITTNYFKNMITEAKTYMANSKNQLPYDEAKYLFFWGIDSYFKKSEEDKEMEE